MSSICGFSKNLKFKNSSEKRKLILQLYSQGLNDAEIARELNIKFKSTVRYFRHKLGLRPNYKKRKIADIERFKELWFADALRREIAKEFGCSKLYVSAKARELHLPTREHLVGRYGVIKRLQAENNILEFLKATENGYAQVSKMPSRYIVQRLVNENRLLKVQLSFKKGSGDFPRRQDRKHFNKGFYGKTFICLDRTAVVRLFMHALKKPSSPKAQKRVTSLCKRYLTHAEWIAVLWSLGIQHFSPSQLKRNMQVNGVYFPMKRLVEVSE